MNVIVHDLNLDSECLNGFKQKAEKVIAADGKYAPCQGCFKCWTKHPAACEMKDSLAEVSRVLGAAENLTVITENCYGGYSPNVKRVIDRGISLSTPMSEYRNGMMHHVLRYGKRDNLRVIVYGDVNEKEKETWDLMAHANSVNFGFRNYSLVFATESDIREGRVR